jgi:hypothetical protein
MTDQINDDGEAMRAFWEGMGVSEDTGIRMMQDLGYSIADCGKWSPTFTRSGLPPRSCPWAKLSPQAGACAFVAS